MKPKEIFVFGSNLAGRHGKGAALEARRKWGAEYGVGQGPTGNAYAIPTKDENLKTLSLFRIWAHVKFFLAYAMSKNDRIFRVTRIGCGLAGYRNEQIAPFFSEAPVNCILPKEWEPFVRRSEFARKG